MNIHNKTSQPTLTQWNHVSNSHCANFPLRCSTAYSPNRDCHSKNPPKSASYKMFHITNNTEPKMYYSHTFGRTGYELIRSLMPSCKITEEPRHKYYSPDSKLINMFSFIGHTKLRITFPKCYVPKPRVLLYFILNLMNNLIVKFKKQTTFNGSI